MAKELIFILGGARSGKSRFAQELALKMGGEVLFIATGEPRDDEMRARIEQHKKARPANWRTLEAPTNLARRLETEIGNARVVIINRLTLLVSNLLGDEADFADAKKRVLAEINSLLTVIEKLDATFIVISNEVGLGLVPETPLGRVYRDILGKAHQLIARHARRVYFIVAGIPVKIKGD